MKCFSLFSGIGGFDLAIQRLGLEMVGACEIDRYARQIYSKHFPEVRIYEDARSINPEELPDFDLLCAGFPCQSFSILGSRQGFFSAKGTMFFEIIRIIKIKKPSLILLENVKGLLTHQKGDTFRTILNALDELGYNVEWCCIDSKYFTPQVRKRVYIVGYIRTKSRSEIFSIRQASKLHNESQKERKMASAVIAGYFKRPSDGCYIDTGNGIRMFTPLECERLQGLPDGYTEGVSDGQRFKCIGNAVTVPVIEHILSLLVNQKEKPLMTPQKEGSHA